MKYSVKIIRNFYNDKAVCEQKQVAESFFESIDSALIGYNCSIIGERVTSETHSYTGSSNIHVMLIAHIDGESIQLESTFIHNGEVR
jgi:hypothetical protein